MVTKLLVCLLTYLLLVGSTNQCPSKAFTPP